MTCYSGADPLIDGAPIVITAVDHFLEEIHQDLALAARVANEFRCQATNAAEHGKENKT